jgi:phage gp29-like protein
LIIYSIFFADNFSSFKEFKSIETEVLGQKQIEDLFDFLTKSELQKQAQEMLSPLVNLIESCGDYDEVYEILTDKNLHSKKLEDSIQKALFLSELMGRSDGLE